MHMSMGYFIFGGISDVHYFHSEVEFNARQGMVAIDGDVVQADMRDGNYLAPVCLKLLANFHRLYTESFAGYLLDHPVVFYPIALFRGYL